MAEGEGFEPPEPFPVQWFSRPPPSTTRPSLRVENLAGIRAISTFAIINQNTRNTAVVSGPIGDVPFGPASSAEAHRDPTPLYRHQNPRKSGCAVSPVLRTPTARRT